MKLSKLRASTDTRTVRGQSIPRENTTSFGLRAALKKGGSRFAGDASGDVEGGAARHRLDRPGRKAGGRVCREEGGRVSDDSKLEAYRLRKEDDKENVSGRNLAEVSAPIGLGLGTLLGARSKIAKGVGAIATGIGASNLGRANDRINAAAARRREIDRIEKGQAKPGEEDRKHGGKVKS